MYYVFLCVDVCFFCVFFIIATGIARYNENVM